MPRILLLSDTHSFLDQRIEKHAKSVDEIWHAGDVGSINVIDDLQKFCPVVRVVYGNIDGQDVRVEHPKDQVFEIQQTKIWMTHIGGYPPKYNPAIKQKLEIIKPQIFICGHSHILKIIFDPKLDCLHLNPGAPGIHGFHHMQTVLKFTIGEKGVKDLEIIELQKNN